MQRSIININSYRYLIEYYNSETDLKNSQYSSEFIMLRNYNIMNNLVHDNDIYLIEKTYFDEFISELQDPNTKKFNIAFPVTNAKINSYSDNYVKFNDNFNLDNHRSIFESIDGSIRYGKDVYELKDRSNNPRPIKCDKIRIYHPSTKRNIDAIIDISNYINNIRFHYLCKPLFTYTSNSENEIKIDNESYYEYIEVCFPSMQDLFGIDDEGNYNVYYIEDFNIVASTRNEKFINSIISNSADIEHFEDDMNERPQLVPFNLFIQPYRIVEEYAAASEFNYDDDLSNDEKIFVKLYLKSNMSINDNYLTNTLGIILYPYSEIDANTNLYILDSELSQGYTSMHTESKFSLMSRIGFSDGVVSIVSLFSYPNKSYFYSMYKDDATTSPVKEAYKYYNNVEDRYYNMFINEEVMQQLEDVDNVNDISDDIRQIVKQVANVNYEDKEELLKVWKHIMKQTILEEYETEFGTPTQFLGFKIDIASDTQFKHIIYTNNVRINFNDIDDFAFKLNNIFDRWEQKPEQLAVRCSFIDHLLGIEIKSNVVIITKEWFKYLINNPKVYRLSKISSINKQLANVDPMKVITLDDNSTVNFINSIKCIVRKEGEKKTNIGTRSIEQKVIFKPIFYKVKDLQNISLRPGLSQSIGINLAEYMTKVDTFRMSIDSKEYIETGRNDIFVIFKINTNDFTNLSGTYNVLGDDDIYISSGNWSIS